MDELMLIKTPITYIRLGATRTLLQQDSLIMVSAYLQQYVLLQELFFGLRMSHPVVLIRD